MIEELGWDAFTTVRGLEIQRDDCEAIFADDDEAHREAVYEAAEGDEYAIAALYFVSANDVGGWDRWVIGYQRRNAKLPREAELGNETVGDLATRLYGEGNFDTSLPSEFVTEMGWLGVEARGRFVWLYGDQFTIGMPAPLTAEAKHDLVQAHLR